MRPLGEWALGRVEAPLVGDSRVCFADFSYVSPPWALSIQGAQNGPFSTWSFLKWTIIRRTNIVCLSNIFFNGPFLEKGPFGRHEMVLFQMVCSRPFIFVSRWTSDLRDPPSNLKPIWIQKVNGPEQTIWKRTTLGPPRGLTPRLLWSAIQRAVFLTPQSKILPVSRIVCTSRFSAGNPNPQNDNIYDCHASKSLNLTFLNS